MRIPYYKVWVCFVFCNTGILLLNAILYVVTGNALFAGTTSEPRMAAIVVYYFISVLAAFVTAAESNNR
jgi:hypothetical protein